jgi:hypothetical protein
MNIINWFKSLFVRENKYKKIAEDLKIIVDDLHLELKAKKEKEIFTFICPPGDDDIQQYLSVLSSFYSNPHSKWFLYQLERSMVSKFKQPDTPAEFCRGALAMIDMIYDGLANASEEIKKINRAVNNG